MIVLRLDNRVLQLENGYYVVQQNQNNLTDKRIPEINLRQEQIDIINVTQRAFKL